MAERNSTGVKNEHTHQCRRKGAFPASLPAIPPGRSRHLGCRVPGTAPSCGACGLAQAGWPLRRAVQGGAGCWGHCSCCYGEKRKHCEGTTASEPREASLGCACVRAAAVGTVTTSILASPRAPAPPQHVGKCFPSANHPATQDCLTLVAEQVK